ncbi:MAG: hypothetical protein ACYC4L_04690 [Chloroflexota bacterium]
MVMTLPRSSSDADPVLLRLRAQAELERRRRAGETSGDGQPKDPFARYRYAPEAYIADKLGWQPWRGDAEHPGQMEVVEAYTLALRQQHERAAFEAGEIGQQDLGHWQPGQPIKNRLRIEAGHTVGKTKLASGLVNHFFDCFVPAIIYTFAPSWEQIHDLLWKEIKADRGGKGLPGRILDLALDRGPDHFAKGRATNNAGGAGTERVQGQHGRYLMFVFDEAEGIADYVWDAVDSMTSGGISIVLMLANPRTRISRFHKAREHSNVQSFRVSCLWHPNVLQNRDVVPNAVKRDYVDMMIEKHCEVMTSHSADDHTFQVPWRQGTIYRPDAEMMFRVLGVAPANIADNTMVPVGRYEAACRREPTGEQPRAARLGVDVARYGKDYGTLYVRHQGRVWRARQFAQVDTFTYYQAIKAEALALAQAGVTSLHVRVDGGGGFGGGVIDQLGRDLELQRTFLEFAVLEVHFNGTPYEADAYADLATEMYGAAGEGLKALAVVDPPDALEADLCERTYTWATRQAVAVKRLESKEDFKKRLGRSPDDGDGFVLAVAPDYVFSSREEYAVYDDPVRISDY